MDVSVNTIQTAMDTAMTDSAKALLHARFARAPRALVTTFGCQQNVADSERLSGVLAALGCRQAQSSDEADIIVFNTCAVRENAERRVLGHVGALKGLKQRRPRTMIILCGCMTQQESTAERLRKSYPYVDIVFGASAAHRLPELITSRIQGERRVIDKTPVPGIVKHLPTRRESKTKAWLPIMQGCDNFCTYCIVPYVRGRERSREPKDVLREARELIESGYKEITLLGQNVNSYGKNMPGASFPALLRDINAIPGDFWVRFMTSHPKDCSNELLDVISACEKVCKHIHLPVQSGSDRTLAAMNRRYTRADYLALIGRAKEKIPGLTLTSDIIVGFPGEGYGDFSQTLSLVREVRYASLFTFLYSRRTGTAAEKLPDEITDAEKSRYFEELLAVQEEVGGEIYRGEIGKTLRVLAEKPGKKAGTLTGRAQSNIIVEFTAPQERAGEFCDVTITGALGWALLGKIQEK